MGKNTAISWTGTPRSDGRYAPGHTFNGWIGCTKVDPACANCYAEEWDIRFKEGKNWGPGAPRHITSDKNWNDPLRWNKEAASLNETHKMFCFSLGDVFDKEAPIGQRERFFKLCLATPNLIKLILTKRPENVLEMLPVDWASGYPNVWIGSSAGTNKTLMRNFEFLSKIPAVFRFFSIEPMLEKMDFKEILFKGSPVNWVIFGGESGDNARPFDLEWIREPIELARKAGIAVFVKQTGNIWAEKNNYKHKKGGDPEEWPEWARIWEWPDTI